MKCLAPVCLFIKGFTDRRSPGRHVSTSFEIFLFSPPENLFNFVICRARVPWLSAVELVLSCCRLAFADVCRWFANTVNRLPWTHARIIDRRSQDFPFKHIVRNSYFRCAAILMLFCHLLFVFHYYYFFF